MSSEDSTFPPALTSPPIANAGVIITPKLVITLMSSIFSTLASMPSSWTACSAFSLSFVHFAPGTQHLYELHNTLPNAASQAGSEFVTAIQPIQTTSQTPFQQTCS